MIGSSTLVSMMSVLSSIALPHWLMIAGTFLLFLGLSGLALRGRTAEAESDAAPRERELFKAPAVESTEEFYNLVAKDSKDRSAEAADDPAELLLRLAGSEVTGTN
jgi:hypothetical protein